VTPDERIRYAQEYLDGARNRPVPTLPPSVMARELAETRRQLGIVLHVLGGLDVGGEDGTEPYCTVCRQWAGMFVGIDGWRHFRGDPAPGGVRELYDAGHEPVIAWTAPPGRALSPGDVATVLDALAVAGEYRRYRGSLNCQACAAHPADLCEECGADLDAAEEYEALAGRLREGGNDAGRHDGPH
jgi:hypothetical protein